MELALYTTFEQLQTIARCPMPQATAMPKAMYVLAPDHLWYLALQPDGVGRTRIRYGAAIAPEMLAA